MNERKMEDEDAIEKKQQRRRLGSNRIRWIDAASG